VVRRPNKPQEVHESTRRWTQERWLTRSWGSLTRETRYSDGNSWSEDWLSELRFRNVLEGLMGQAGQRRVGVRIFGEMVAVLWVEGHTRAAISWEEFWNQLATEQPVSLWCVYPMSKITGEKKQRFSDRHIPTANETQGHNHLSSWVSDWGGRYGEDETDAFCDNCWRSVARSIRDLLHCPGGIPHHDEIESG